MNDVSTKEKILKHSHKLFSEKGFNGVSIREIAKVCDVNVAAINYHFKNKESLYEETVRQSMVNSKNDIERIYHELPLKNIESLAKKTFEHFLANSDDLRTGFKLILSMDSVCQAFSSQLKEYVGPPGGEYFHECLKVEFPKAKDEDLHWAVRVIYSHLIHKAIILCNQSICTSIAEAGFDKSKIVDDMLRLVKVVKAEIR